METTAAAAELLRELETHLAVVEISAQRNIVPHAGATLARRILNDALMAMALSPNPNLPPIDDSADECPMPKKKAQMTELELAERRGYGKGYTAGKKTGRKHDATRIAALHRQVKLWQDAAAVWKARAEAQADDAVAKASDKPGLSIRDKTSSSSSPDYLSVLTDDSQAEGVRIRAVVSALEARAKSEPNT